MDQKFIKYFSLTTISVMFIGEVLSLGMPGLSEMRLVIALILLSGLATSFILILDK